MKLIFFTICAIVTVAVNAVPTEELLEQCAVCDNYFAFLTTNHGQIDNMPMEFDVFASFDDYKKLCAACNLDEESDEETDNVSNEMENELQQQDELSLDGIQENEDEEEFEDVDTTNFLSITNCKTCRQIIEFTANNSLDFSYQAIKSALSKACSSHQIKFLDDTRCRLFIKVRKDQIIKAIYHYHMDSTGTCLELKQC